jgi:hypothetical protein
MLVAAVLVALAIWTWMPPTKSAQQGIRLRRRTLRGEVVVRAAVASWGEVGVWDVDQDEVVDVTRREQTSCPVFDYTTCERDDFWKVVDRAAPDGGPFFYGAETGEYGTGL